MVGFFSKLPACLVDMEACSSAHYWVRELRKLGHQVRLIPPQYVEPFVKTTKNDASDAEAICEANRVHDLLVRWGTMLIIALRLLRRQAMHRSAVAGGNCRSGWLDTEADIQRRQEAVGLHDLAAITSGTRAKQYRPGEVDD